MTELAAFLAVAAGKRFRLGVHDCGLWLADWLMMTARQGDLAFDLRGRYRDEHELAALTGTRDVLRLLARRARAAGIARTTMPRPGDVGVIVIAGGRPTGAIRTARGWAVIGQGGGISRVVQARVLVAWAVPHA
jgi:hypothetical protein